MKLLSRMVSPTSGVRNRPQQNIGEHPRRGKGALHAHGDVVARLTNLDELVRRRLGRQFTHLTEIKGTTLREIFAMQRFGLTG